MINLKMIRDFMKKGFLLLMVLLLVPKAEAQTSDDNYRMPIAGCVLSGKNGPAYFRNGRYYYPCGKSAGAV